MLFRAAYVRPSSSLESQNQAWRNSQWPQIGVGDTDGRCNELSFEPNSMDSKGRKLTRSTKLHAFTDLQIPRIFSGTSLEDVI